ncbi:MAG: CoA transferase [Actinomycetota bacterium]|nr:CoA transferase [Actinomycetota bacterium]
MLSNYRVIDLADERGHLAGLMLRQLGADVIVVEPPRGSSVRRQGPFAGDVVDDERSLHHWAYNRVKRSVVLDLDNAEGRERLHELIAGADVLIETYSPSERTALGLDPVTLGDANPALIHASISAYGSTGPKAAWPASDLTIQAASGSMAITGDKDCPPIRAGSLPQAWHVGASEAAVAILIALLERQGRSGLGQHIDASCQQSMNQAAQSMMMAVPNRATSTTRIAGGANLQGIDIQLMWPCKDGYASVTLLFGMMIAPFTQNLFDWVYEEGFCDEATRSKDWVEYAVMLLDGREPVEEYERVKACLTAFFATKTKAELLDAAIDRKVLITPVWTAGDVVASPQLASRDYWEDIEQLGVGTVRHPGAFAKFLDRPLEVLPAAPVLGAHTGKVFAEPPRSPAVDVSPPRPDTSPPLADLKILDLSWVMAGPAASRVFADYGAQIIRIESSLRPDGARTMQPFTDDVTDPHYSGLWNNLNAGKKGLSLNLAAPEANEVLWDLVDWADLVMDSFGAGALARMGFGHEALLARKPSLVVASSCLMGQTGPLASLTGFGTMAAAISGFFHPVGWPDRAPCGPFGAYTDYTSPRWFAAAILGALEHSRATGEGLSIDFSQGESAMQLLAPALLDNTVNGRVWERNGNRDLVHAPHGAYATAGDDCWIAIACTDDGEWATLAELIGRPDWSSMPNHERHSRAEELDDAITAFTSGHDGDELMGQLIEAGVTAHVVQNSAELAADPQLIHRHHFVEVAHSTQPDDRTVVEGTRFIMSRTPAVFTRGGPTFGEDTFEVLTDVLGYDGDRIAELAVAEALE